MVSTTSASDVHSLLPPQPGDPLVAGKDARLVPGGIRGVWFFLRLCSWWFAFCTMVGPLTPILWPAQVQQMVGPEEKEKYNGFVPAFGAVISLFTTPITGMLSDRTTSRLGRRKVYMIAGSIVCLIFLVLCSTATSIWVFILYTIGFQLGITTSAGPYAGLIPDSVHPSQSGKGSGFNGFAATLGYLVGILGAGFFSNGTSFLPAYTFLACMFVVFSLPTFLGFHEIPRDDKHPPLTCVSFAKSFYLDSSRYRAFYWVIVSRFLEMMGTNAVSPFLQYFIEDVIFAGSPNESRDHEFYSTVAVAIIAGISIPSSILCSIYVDTTYTAGSLSDRFGKKKMAILSVGVMTIGLSGFLITCFVPSLIIMLSFTVIFGIGYGAFQAVDWALALDTLPEGADSAKDMGIWHMSFVLPQVFSPMITGQIISRMKHTFSFQLAYAVVFAVSCAWLISSAICIIPIKLEKKEPIELE